MTYDKEFLAWWNTNDSASYSSQPAFYRSKAMKDLAYQAWLAGYVQCENDNDIDCHLEGHTDYRYAQ